MSLIHHAGQVTEVISSHNPEITLKYFSQLRYKEFTDFIRLLSFIS